MVMAHRSILLFVFASLLTCGAGVCQEKADDIWGPNLIRNSEFEDGLSGWEVGERRGAVRFGTGPPSV